jgi:hypothetical protein
MNSKHLNNYIDTEVDDINRFLEISKEYSKKKKIRERKEKLKDILSDDITREI